MRNNDLTMRHVEDNQDLSQIVRLLDTIEKECPPTITPSLQQLCDQALPLKEALDARVIAEILNHLLHLDRATVSALISPVADPVDNMIRLTEECTTDPVLRNRARRLEVLTEALRSSHPA